MSAATEQLRESRGAIADVFRNQGLRRLNLALAGSVIGDWAMAVAMAVYAYQRGGPTTVGTLGVVRYVSMSLLAPIVALLADRLDRRKVMVGSDLARTIITGAMAGIVLADGPSLAVYALAVLNGWVGLAFRPAEAALLPTLANTPAELTAANVTSKTIHSVGFFIGPALAGLFLALTDIGWVFVLNSLSFVWSGLLVLGLARAHRSAGTAASAAGADAVDGDGDGDGDGNGDSDGDSEGGSKLSMFAGVGDGYRAIFANRDLRLMIGLYVAQTIIAGASVVYEVAIALDLLDLQESSVGVLNAALGIGGILGGVVALLLAQRGKLARDFGLGVSLWAAPLLLVAAWPSLFTALLAMALIGVGNSVVDVNAETIIQRLVPDAVLGRVFGALDSAAIGGMAIGSLAMPILIKTMGLRSGLVVIGVGVTVMVAMGLRGLARIDRTALAPDGLDLLRSVPMLAVLPDHLIERLARRSVVVTVPKGATVFREGDEGDRFYIVETGTADVSIGGEFRRTVEAGGSFGEIALLRAVPRTATIVATSDLVMRGIDRRHFLPAVTGSNASSEQADSLVARYLAG